MVSTIALSVLFAWLFNRTRGSVLPALVLHTAINAWDWVIPDDRPTYMPIMQ